MKMKCEVKVCFIKEIQHIFKEKKITSICHEKYPHSEVVLLNRITINKLYRIAFIGYSIQIEKMMKIAVIAEDYL